MSIEITLHPEHASKQDLRQFLERRGFRPCSHIGKWPSGTLHLHWFEHKDYLSFDGVEATIFKPTEMADLGACEWALHTRTRASASPADQAFQNDTVRQARSLFGGNFYNDAAGRNRYTGVPVDVRDAAARGLYLSYEVVRQHLSAVAFAAPPEHEGLAKFEKTRLKEIARMDPARVIYNALVPFAVASLEAFFGDAFKILIRYEQSAQAYMTEQSKKIDFEDAMALSRGETSLEQIVASWYSFQNVASIQKAFNEWLGFDFRAALRKDHSRHDKSQSLDVALEQMIGLRHKIVHGLEMDFDLTRQRLLNILDDAQAIIDAFVAYIESTRSKVIRDETLLAVGRQV